jgi:kynurenine formamidase
MTDQLWLQFADQLQLLNPGLVHGMCPDAGASWRVRGDMLCRCGGEIHNRQECPSPRDALAAVARRDRYSALSCNQIREVSTVGGVTDPESGLEFHELSHEWGHGVPMQPGYADVQMHRSSQHARNGVMAHRIRMVMHSGTHLNAPRHLIQKGIGVGEIPMQRLFGSGVVLSITKSKWELIEIADLEAARPAIQEDDIVVLHTGWHRQYSDSQEYFGHSPGLSKAAAEWLVAQRIKLLATDTPQVDHPLATSLGPHRNGPLIKRLPKDYEIEKGRTALADFPDWNPAHRALLAAGIPTIENVGGEVGMLSGRRCTFHAYPWNWPEGDACPVRFVAICDPRGSYRIGDGKGE